VEKRSKDLEQRMKEHERSRRDQLGLGYWSNRDRRAGEVIKSWRLYALV
jgi:hypothetical protein